MNSYNENFHSTIVASLLELEQYQKRVKSQLDASIFALYYAAAARLAADERLQSTHSKYIRQQRIVEQTVSSSNISANVLLSATQQKACTAQSVTDMAVGASNMQVAANAILRLAANMGSVYAILSAADYDSEIYEQAKDVKERMEDTAYAAEMASQLAMEASASIAEVSSSVIADTAKTANNSISNLLQVTATDFDSVKATLAAQSETATTANTAERLAEGTLENINVEYFATRSAYEFTNKSLNLNLSIDRKTKTNKKYTVLFNNYTSLFVGVDNPMSTYNILLVKDTAKSAFSILSAEALLSNDKKYKGITGPFSDAPISSEIFITDLEDSDGDSMKLGVKYVVFVLVTFKESYKRSINNFDDYLSAPSATFMLTNKLQSPAAADVQIVYEKRDSDTTAKQYVTFPIPVAAADESSVLIDPDTIEYRCILLPDSIKDKDTWPEFFFNLKLAEQITAANYTVDTINVHTKGKYILINENTTDSFGNLLIEGNNYTPVILSVSSVPEENLVQYTNALSDFVNTKSFIYSAQN